MATALKKYNGGRVLVTRAPHFTPQHWLLCHMGLY